MCRPNKKVIIFRACGIINKILLLHSTGQLCTSSSKVRAQQKCQEALNLPRIASLTSSPRAKVVDQVVPLKWRWCYLVH